MSDDVQPIIDVDSDPILTALVAMAQESELSMGITLNVRGLLASGQLIGRDTWVRRFGELASHTPAGASLAGGIESALLQADLEREEDVQYGYLHLEGRVWTSEVPIPPHDAAILGLWRFRLSEISGWSLGSLGPPA